MNVATGYPSPSPYQTEEARRLAFTLVAMRERAERAESRAQQIEHELNLTRNALNAAEAHARDLRQRLDAPHQVPTLDPEDVRPYASLTVEHPVHPTPHLEHGVMTATFSSPEEAREVAANFKAFLEAMA